MFDLEALRLPENFRQIVPAPWDDEGWEIYNAEIEEQILDDEDLWDEGL